ncbi:MAG TPA: hypothetical protein ENH82_01525, partial [bacterium]|nr:hypothetical protein [bacterium]
MTRIEAKELLNQYVSTEWLKKHSIAAAAVMQGLAGRLERDPDEELLNDAAGLSAEDIVQLSRPGFMVKFYDTLESFYTAEALEYVVAWQQATDSEPTGICGPIGPTEQLPLVVQIINDLEIDVRKGHFWGMDEWYMDGKEIPITHSLSFARADLELCFNRIEKGLRMRDENLHFLRADNIEQYTR